MGSYKPSFQLGSLTLPNNIFCSPLAGCSDFSFRKMVGKYRPGLTFCEMVKMDALVRHDAGTYRLLEYDGSMHPIGAQLCGSQVKYAASCARIVEDLGFDVIDLNCGCPVDKVTKDQSGSGLLKSPQLIGEILLQMVGAVSIPVTVKIRAGWDEESIVGPMVTRIAEEAGAKIIFVHGRTRKQGYRGPANWEYIAKCKKAARSILVFGNGDIVDPSSAKKMFETTKCDGLLLSRGLFGHPWIIEDIARAFEGKEAIERDPGHIRDVFIEHIEYIIASRPKKRALLDLRRIGAWYLKNASGVKKLRELIVRADDLEQSLEQIRAFNWEQ